MLPVVPFQAREARAFPPEPSAPARMLSTTLRRSLAPGSWDVSPVGRQGSEFRLHCSPDRHNVQRCLYAGHGPHSGKGVARPRESKASDHSTLRDRWELFP